jgi:peroxiredoxin
MTRIHQLLSLFLATLFISLGVWLLTQSDLPNRADYTGNNIEDIGYVAPELNNIAPPFTLSTVNFEKLATSDLHGQVVIINFWATWCVPCRAEMPELQALYDQYEDDIRILGVNLGESPQSVAQWIDEFDLTYDILLDPVQSVAQHYQIRGQPSTYVLDTQHMIRAIYYGSVSMEQLENDIIRILNKD